MNPVALSPEIAQAIAAALATPPNSLNKLNDLPPMQIILGAKDFLDSYQDMRMKNLIGYDKYAHARANANATKRGKYGEHVAQIISALKEVKDLPKYTKIMSPVDALLDSYDDIQANIYGREQAKKYPDVPTHELLQKYWIKDETGQIAK